MPILSHFHRFCEALLRQAVTSDIPLRCCFARLYNSFFSNRINHTERCIRMLRVNVFPVYEKLV